MLRFPVRRGTANLQKEDLDTDRLDGVTSHMTPHRIEETNISPETQSEKECGALPPPGIGSAPNSRVFRRGEESERLSDLRRTSSSHHTGRSITGITFGNGAHSEGFENNATRALLKERQKSRSLSFSRQVSTFDAQSEAAANSPFHGFYNLFWLSVALLICKISANNWQTYGNLLGPSDILKTMFRRDVIMLLLSDGVMCSLTVVSWLLQKLVLAKNINWDREGWILQHTWQTVFIAGAVKWTVYRDWPWTHTVFFVLHALVMLMKQHSYAFTNGHLSKIYHKRQLLLGTLKKLEFVNSTRNPFTTPTVSTILLESSSASLHRDSSDSPSDFYPNFDALDIILKTIDTSKTLPRSQVSLFGRAINNEIGSLSDELKGTAGDSSRAYPHNLTFLHHYEWIPFPTVVYELEYPRLGRIDWAYLAEKVAAMIGIIFVMIQVSQHYIYPVVLITIEMRENNTPLGARFGKFPWLLGELLFPFMMEYLLAWYLIWETVLNILAELTYFADRQFYGSWWNSVSWDQFARDWNRPVHLFLLRHVYHSSISSLNVSKQAATIITFFLSACIHEFIMWCIFKKLRGYLLILQMCQLPLVRLSQTRWLMGRKTLGNLIFWLGIYTGPSVLCSLYLIL